MKCLDSTHIIDFLRNNTEAVNKIKNTQEELATTEINVYEILTGIYKYSTKIQQEKTIFQQLLDRVTVLPLNRQATDKAAQINAELTKKGKNISPPDIIIAGIMLAHGCTKIITRNTYDFNKIKELTVEEY